MLEDGIQQKGNALIRSMLMVGTMYVITAIFYFLKTAVTMTIFCQSFVLEETHSGKMLGFAFCRPLLAKITAPWQVRGT